MLVSQKLLQSVFYILVGLCLSTCVTPKDKSKDDGDDKGKSKKEKADDAGKNDEGMDNSDDGPPPISAATGFGDLSELTYSLSNNSATSFAIEREKADTIAEKISADGAKDQKSIAAVMAAKRLAGKGLNTAILYAKKLAAIEMQKNVASDMPDFAKLELVLSAIQARKYAFAELFIGDLKESKDKRIIAGAYNAEGIIYAVDGRYPEAVLSWSKALDFVSEYKAAMYNIAYTSLKFGDFDRARNLLNALQSDWFAAAGLISVERMTGNTDRPGQLCSRVLEADGKNKTVLFNCGLYEFQNNANFAAARKYFNLITKIKTLNTKIDELAYTQLSLLDDAEDRARNQAKAKAK